MRILHLLVIIFRRIKNRRTQMKNVSKNRSIATNVCECGGEIVEVNRRTRRRACLKCGKEAIQDELY